MYCPNCGNQLGENVIVCPVCMCNAFPYIDAVNKWTIYLNNARIVANRNTSHPEEHKVDMGKFIPAVVLYTIFIGFILFVVGGQTFSFSTNPIDTFKSTLKKNDFVEEDGERYTKTLDGVTTTFDLDDYLFIMESDSQNFEYNYKTNIVHLVFKESIYTFDTIYYYNTGEYTCETVPAYNSATLCSAYRPSIIKLSIQVKEGFESIIEKTSVTVEDLTGGEK